MMTKLFQCPLARLLLTGLLLTATQVCVADDRAAFIGSWALISVENRGADGSVEHPFGLAPLGRITYTDDGLLSAHVMRADRPAFAGQSLYGGNAEQKATAYDSYIAYYGAFDVDPVAHTVTHHLTGSLFPNWSGSEQTRFYALEGDTLTLSTPTFKSGDRDISVHVIWRRITND